jgi:hypothetical protein
MNGAESTEKGVRGNTTHGLAAMKRAVKTLDGRVIDRRTSLGKALDQWRSDLLRDLGRPGEVSTQKLALVDLARPRQS